MLSVDGNPFLGHHARADPRPETEKVGEHGMEIHTAMRLAAMQIQRDRKDGQLRHDEEIDELGHPRRVGEAVVQKIQDKVEHEITPPKEKGLYVSQLRVASEGLVPIARYHQYAGVLAANQSTGNNHASFVEFA
jgi:hypothetical protein